MTIRFQRYCRQYLEVVSFWENRLLYMRLHNHGWLLTAIVGAFDS